jgi:hypothetical protein
MEMVMKNEIPSLIIKIEYKDHISLLEFKESIEGWNNQYNLFVSQNSDDEKNDRLLIKEIKHGSIIIELISALQPLIADFNTVLSFYTSIKNIFDWLSTKSGSKPGLSTSDLDNAKKIIAPINKHSGRQITVSIEGNNNAPILIDSAVAEMIEKNADDELSSLVKPILHLPEYLENKENVIFKLTQIKDDENPNKNTKGIIQEVDSKEHMILFSSVEIKEEILQESSNPFRKNYLVNVKVNMVNNAIKSYTILDLHDSYVDEEDEGVDLFSQN